MTDQPTHSDSGLLALDLSRDVTLMARVYDTLWEVRFADRLPRYAGRQVQGLCDYNNRIIWVRRTMQPHEIVEVLTHEVIHAWFQSADEEVVTDCAQQIADILFLRDVGGIDAD